jgi:hypothetical protein
MPRIVYKIAIVAMLLSTVLARVQAADEKNISTKQVLTQAEALNLQNLFFDALIARDEQKVRSLAADDLTYSHVGGLMQSKDEFISWMATHTFVKFDLHNPKVFLYPGTVVVTGKNDVTSQQPGVQENRLTHYIMTAVWVRKNVGWQVILIQYAGVTDAK